MTNDEIRMTKSLVIESLDIHSTFVIEKFSIKMSVKALALFSGGLDSTLAAKIILDHGVEVEGVFFVNAFLAGQRNGQKGLLQLQQSLAAPQTINLPNHKIEALIRGSGQLGIRLHILDISEPHLALVRNPRYGYGENMNPCIDCRILMLRQAKAYMESHHFSFLISGEVLGQRPMSQRKDTLNIIERDAQVKGLLLRPLSAKRLAPTIAETAGWVDREKLFGFSGRSRKPQLALAKELGISEYSSPAGGCLLTETEFAKRFKDLLEQGSFNLNDTQLLKVGRHFRYTNFVKIIVGRNDEENRCIMNLAQGADMLFKIRDFAGPLTIVRSVNLAPDTAKDTKKSRNRDLKVLRSLVETVAKVTVHYSKAKGQKKVWVDYWSKKSGTKRSILVTPAAEDLIEKMRI